MEHGTIEREVFVDAQPEVVYEVVSSPDYGAQLSGLPGIGIGFTEEFGWTHTVSAGNRFTAYRLRLVPGSPTTYMYGDGQRSMRATDVTVDVLQPDGTVARVTRTMYSSHYGPMLDFPGVGWTAETAITYRDANIDNDEFVEQYFGMDNADDFDAFVAVHKKWQGVPLFNTIVVSKDGRDLVRRHVGHPNLSDEAIAAYEASIRPTASRRWRPTRGRWSSTGPTRCSSGSRRRAPTTPDWCRTATAEDRARRLRVQRQRLVLGAAREEVARRRLLAAARPPGDRPLTADRENAAVLGDTSATGRRARTASSRSTSSPTPRSRTGATRHGSCSTTSLRAARGSPPATGGRRARLTSRPPAQSSRRGTASTTSTAPVQSCGGR